MGLFQCRFQSIQIHYAFPLSVSVYVFMVCCSKSIGVPGSVVWLSALIGSWVLLGSVIQQSANIYTYSVYCMSLRLIQFDPKRACCPTPVSSFIVCTWKTFQFWQSSDKEACVWVKSPVKVQTLETKGAKRRWGVESPVFRSLLYSLCLWIQPIFLSHLKRTWWV